MPREVQVVLVPPGIDDADLEGHVRGDLDPELEVAVAEAEEVQRLVRHEAGAEPAAAGRLPGDAVLAFVGSDGAVDQRAFPHEDLRVFTDDELGVGRRLVGVDAEGAALGHGGPRWMSPMPFHS